MSEPYDFLTDDPTPTTAIEWCLRYTNAGNYMVTAMGLDFVELGQHAHDVWERVAWKAYRLWREDADRARRRR